MSSDGLHTDGVRPSSADVDGVSDEITGMLAELLGEDVVTALEVGPESSFTSDLELESIEFVALAEMMQERYGSEVDFVAWMAEMDLDQIMGLTVGSVAAFVAETRPR